MLASITLVVKFRAQALLKKCVENLVSSANRALFSLKRYFSRNKETLPEVQIRLFDSMVAPITFHGR